MQPDACMMCPPALGAQVILGMKSIKCAPALLAWPACCAWMHLLMHIGPVLCIPAMHASCKCTRARCCAASHTHLLLHRPCTTPNAHIPCVVQAARLGGCL